MSNSALIKQFDAPLGSAAFEDVTTVQANGVNFKNKIINGSFDVWQRGTSFSVTTHVYTADRWKISPQNGEATVGKIDSGVLPNYIEIDMITLASNYKPYIAQYIEDFKPMSGKTYTLSFISDGNKEIPLVFSVIGSATYIDEASIGTTAIGKELSITFTLPDLSADTGDGLGIYIQMPLNDTYIFQMTQVQLEEGSVATEFEQRPLSVEEMLCYRYFETGESYRSCIVTQGTAGVETTNFKVTKRCQPTTLITETSALINCTDVTPLEYSPTAFASYPTGGNDTLSCRYQMWWTADAEL